MGKFEEILSASGLPEAATDMVLKKLNEAEALIRQNNEWVAQINAAKASDPNNPEVLDSLWRANTKGDPKIEEIEPRYQQLVDEAEKLLKVLREQAKLQIPEQLSEERAKEVKKLVNESAPAIEKAKQGAAAFAEMIDNVLASMGKPIEGGLLSLLPPVESLKNARGRKANSGGDGVTYMTRVGEILVDGKSTNREINGEMKGKFNFAADSLSEEFNGNAIADNRVTAEELETAFFDHLGIPFRSKKAAELDEIVEFTFTKEVKKQNPNDDGFTTAPVSKRITWKRPESKAKVETPAAESKTETPQQETPSVSNAKATPEPLKVSDHVKPEPAKKTAAAPKK